jgi:hypothetical protein
MSQIGIAPGENVKSADTISALPSPAEASVLPHEQEMPCGGAAKCALWERKGKLFLLTVRESFQQKLRDIRFNLCRISTENGSLDRLRLCREPLHNS